MAKTQPRRKSGRRKQAVPEAELPQRVNYLILIAGVAVVLIGMLVMSSGDDVSASSVTIAPLLLVLGYCVIIPLGIIYRKKQPAADSSNG